MSNFEQLQVEQNQARDFMDIRQRVAHKFFGDASFNVFDAMYEMSVASEEYVSEIAADYPPNVLWVGGSLGRREMLPNSDIDLFVVYDSVGDPQNDIRVNGVDKFEIGHIDRARLNGLLQFSFIDANRFIDGRHIGPVSAGHVERMILDVNTPDRQLANNISEYFYYRLFDFPQKTTEVGPNLKYSTGSSRDTIFFNMICRMTSGQFPAVRGSTPELAEVLSYAEDRYDIRPPESAINLLFLAKNAAISVYDATGDERSRYVSPHGLRMIHTFCEPKLQALGIQDERHFIDSYGSARNELELAVDTLFTKAVEEHPAGQAISELLSLQVNELTGTCLRILRDPEVQYPQSLIALVGWLAMRSRLDPDDMDTIVKAMMEQPVDKVWGGLMSMTCAPTTPYKTLDTLLDWLYAHDKGAYLTKLISRNPTSSPQTKSKALRYYREKEIIL